LRHGPANHRHAVGVVALIASAALPIVSTSSVTSQRTTSIAFIVPAPPHGSAPSPSRNTTPTVSSPGPLSRTIAYKQTTATTLALAYLLLLSFCFAKLLRALIRTALIRRGARVAIQSPVLRQVRARCAECFGLSDIQLLTSARILTPAAAGLLRKVIILPETLLRSTNEEELTTAVGHEMAHLARHDFAFNVLYQLLYLPISFNPASWLILRSIEETREMACDELVTTRVLDPCVYARSLVSFAAAAINAVPKPSYLLGVFGGNILEHRVRRLLHRPAVNLKRARMRLAASLTALVLCSIVSSGIAVKAHAQNSADVAPKVKALEPLMQQLSENRDDLQLLNQVQRQLAEILSIDPINQQGLNGMLNLSLWTNKPEEAREWARKIVAAYPKEKTAYYSLAVTDWAVAFPAIITARKAAGLRPDSPQFLPDSYTRATLRDQYGPTIDEGVRNLDNAIKIDSNYSDAMAYMSLLYRLKALMAENIAGSTANLKEADEWVKKSLAAKPKDHRNFSPLAPPLPPPPPPPPPPNK
ncbi:MAG: M48 family metalloprotease, partial [Acidobacteriaceae bacterium]|nr:M48 family metalloprotease [Acidobacteriaceae bacterium]